MPMPELLKCPFFILDDDQARASYIKSVIDKTSPDSFDVLCDCSPAELCAHLRNVTGCVLCIAARGIWSELSGVEIVRQFVCERENVQVIYIDGAPSAAYEVYKTPHVILLPPNPSQQDVEYALEGAKGALERYAIRPMMIKTRLGDRVIDVRQVSYIESDRRILNIHIGKEILKTYGKLSSFVEFLPSSFFQCHKSFLVNLAQIERVVGDTAYLFSGDSVPISQKRRKQTRDALRLFLNKSFS